jgi:hypothetical protein
MRRIAIGALLAFICAALPIRAQDATYPPHKPSPAKIEPQIEFLAESGVQTGRGTMTAAKAALVWPVGTR